MSSEGGKSSTKSKSQESVLNSFGSSAKLNRRSLDDKKGLSMIEEEKSRYNSQGSLYDENEGENLP